jgi:hypothetical protein
VLNRHIRCTWDMCQKLALPFLRRLKKIYFNLGELFLKVPVYQTFKKFSITLELSEIFFANAFNLLSGEWSESNIR